MEISLVPALLELDPVEHELFLGLLQVQQEPLERLANVARVETEAARHGLARLVARKVALQSSTPHPVTYRLADLGADSALAVRLRQGAGARTARLELELELIDEVRSLGPSPFINVVAIRSRSGPPAPAAAIVEYLRDLYPYLDLRLGTRCNFNCRYCLVGEEKRLTRAAADVRHELELGRRCGLLRVAFTGGEPMLHPRLLELSAQARELGYERVILVTNASLLAERSNLLRVLAAGVDAVGFSFDAPEQRVAEYLWRNAAYPAVVRGIEHLMAQPGLRLGSISVITRQTYRLLPELARFLVDAAARRPVPGRFLPNVDFVMPEENAWTYRRALVPTFTEVAPFVREALAVAADSGLTLSYRGIPACVMGERFLDRDMDRCMSIFQVHETGEAVVFNRTTLDLYRQKAAACRHCRHDRWCPGVYRSYAHHHGLGELRAAAEGST